MNFVGIDLHKKTISLCVVDQERNVLDRKRFYCCQPERIGAFFERLRPFHAVVEATASYEWLVKLIEPAADRVVLAHPKKLRIIAESVMKTDAVDARAERIGALEPVAADLLHARRRRVRAARVSSRAAEPGTHAHDAEESRARRVPWASVKGSRLSMPTEPSGTETRALRA